MHQSAKPNFRSRLWHLLMQAVWTAQRLLQIKVDSLWEKGGFCTPAGHQMGKEVHPLGGCLLGIMMS